MSGEELAWEQVIRVPPVEIDYANSALVVIDLQNGFARRDQGLFKRLRETGLGEESEYAIARLEQVVVPAVHSLAAAFRAAGRPVVFARCASLRGDGSDQTARHRAQGLAFPHWSQLAQIIDDLEPEQGDIVLTKTGSGVFHIDQPRPSAAQHGSSQRRSDRHVDELVRRDHRPRCR